MLYSITFRVLRFCIQKLFAIVFDPNTNPVPVVDYMMCNV
jgi:hypothetical protein